MRSALPIAFCLMAAGCASAEPPVPDPKRTIERFLAALEADRLQEAYALLHPDLRALMTRERFAELAHDNHAELRELARTGARAAGQGIVEAEVTTEQGEIVTVVLEDGVYRVAGGVLDAQSLSTPLHAVFELRRALERRHLPSLLRVLTEERRAAFSAAFDRSLAQTSNPLELRISESGDTALIELPDGTRIELRRQASEWHIHDIRDPPTPDSHARQDPLGQQ